MRFTLQHPIASPSCSPAFLTPANIVRLARAGEAAGLDALAFTEHPAPSQKWLSAGGHDSFDPLTALAFCAAATERIRLMPYLLVLPYRNPFLAAKQLATLDVLSGGRLVVGVGTGYLRSEFSALGVEHVERSELLDEGIDVLLRIWAGDDVRYEGRHFVARGQTARPRPLQRPHPPLWVGGNSRRARDRVVRVGQGWAPLLVDGDIARSLGTPPLADVAALRSAIADLKERAAAAGRDGDDLDVQIEGAATVRMDGDPAEVLDRIAGLADAGVTWMVVDPPGDDVERSLDVIAAYGEQVVRQSR